MSLLVNQNWVGLDGAPVTGAVPPQLLVMQGRLTPGQYGAVVHAYHLFCLGKTVAVGDFLVANRTLSDGTRVRCESRQNIDRVLVWSTSEDDGNKLPHGFGIVTDWQDPRFYWKPGKGPWSAPGNAPPQLQKGDVTYNHVTYEVKDGAQTRWEFYPLVHGAQAKKLWGWAPYKTLEMTHKDAAMPEAGFGRSKNAIVPIALTYSDGKKLVRRSRHFAVDDWILAQDGQKLHAMEVVEPMTLNGADPLRKLPPCSDATGKEVALQQWRRWLVSPMNEIYRFRMCNEVLKRTGPKQYARIARHEEEFSTALRLPNSEAQFGGLEEDPEEPLLQRLTGVAGTVWQIGTVAYTEDGGRPYVIPDPYWSGEIRWVNHGCSFFALGEVETRGIHRSTAGGWRRHSGALKDKDEYPHYMAVPGWSAIEYCRFINELAYPPEIFMQAAAKIARTVADVGDLRNCYGLAYHLIYRRNAEHSIDENPKLTLDFGWAQIHMLEGEVKGEYEARANEDHRTIKNSYVHHDHETAVEKNWWTYADLTGMPDDDGGGTVGYTKLNATMGSLVDFAAIKEKFPDNNITLVDDSDKQEPTCTGSYSYKTRYILDFDNRARFCAALRVEVSCTGASWSQIPDRYLGALQDDGPANYTAKVFFEVRVGAATYSKLLVEDSASKNAFEFRAILYDNVLIWPQADFDRPLWVYMPPEVVPPMEAHMHLEAIAAHQGVNTRFAGHDVPGDGAAIPTKQTSEKQLEYSQYDGATEIPHPKRPSGRLYARTFTLAEFLDSALWIFGRRFLKFDASKNINYLNPDSPPWHYFPKLGAAITGGEKIHIEFRDNAFVDWSDDIPARKGAQRPAKEERNIEIYYV